MGYTQLALICILQMAMFFQKAWGQANSELHVRAYKNYWINFENYEKEIIKEGKESYAKSLESIHNTFRKKDHDLAVKEIELLKTSIIRYKQQLAEHPDAPNRPYVMLNLANVYLQLSKQETSDETESAYVDQAIVLLLEIEKKYSYFEMREQSLYLMALAYHQKQELKSALTTWQQLVKIAQNTIYGVHAHIALGDYFFAKDMPKEAFGYYNLGYDLLVKLNVVDKDFELIKLEYRSLWAAYRVGDFVKVNFFGKNILRENRFVLTIQELANIRLDAIELIGDSLFDLNDPSEVKKFLISHDVKDSIPAIGLRLVKRFHFAKDYEHVIEVASDLLNRFTITREHPVIFHYLALAYRHTGQIQKQMKIYESLAYYLPNKSVWRAKFDKDLISSNVMEKIAFPATEMLAFWLYESAFNTQSAHIYLKAASFFAILLEFRSNHEKSTNWALHRANCYYFANQFDEAISQYKKLRDGSQLSDSMMQTVSYQIVLSYEQKWRQEFKDLQEDIEKEQHLVQANLILSDLEKAIDDYVTRYPNTERSIDLLLVGASAFRDQGNLQKAVEMWQKVLLSKGNQQQRNLAIRGIIFSEVQGGNPAKVILSARRFLRLQNEHMKSSNLSKELLAVLSQASFEESKRLNENGHILEGGQLLLKIAEEFAKIPNRAKLFRDSAFMFAMNGEWQEALEVTKKYEYAGLYEYRSDMLYLKARSLEYLLRFSQSADVYYEVAKNFPTHKKAITALAKAEKYASAENNYDLAAKSAFSLSERSKNEENRIMYLNRAVEHAIKANQFEIAIRWLKQKISQAKQVDKKLRNYLLIAKVFEANNQPENALNTYREVNRIIHANRKSVSSESYKDIFAFANLRIGYILRIRLAEIDLAGSFQLQASIVKKINLFGELQANLEQAVEALHTNWTPEARWLLAQTSEEIAIEILNVLEMQNKSHSIERNFANKIREQVKVMFTNAKKLHGANLLAQAQAVNFGKENPFITKSKIRLAHSLGDLTNLKAVTYKKPHAMPYDLPFSWSL